MAAAALPYFTNFLFFPVTVEVGLSRILQMLLFTSCLFAYFLFCVFSSPIYFNDNNKKNYYTIYPTFSCQSLSKSLSLTPTIFCNNEFVSEGQRERAEEQEWKRKVREKEIESESERDKGADGMDAKNQQSHVRLIKINSFSLHSLRLSLFLFLAWRAQGVLSKCFLRKSRNTS